MHDLVYNKANLYLSLCSIESQCRSAGTGDMWSVFLVYVIIRAATFPKC